MESNNTNQSFIEKIKDNIIMISIVSILLTLLIIFGIYKYIESNKITESNLIGEIVSEFSFDRCKSFVDLESNISKGNKYIDYTKLGAYKFKCDEKYNIKNLKINKDNCSEIISVNTKKDLAEDYVILDDYYKVKSLCMMNFLTGRFSTGTFFNPNQDFKSSIQIDFDTNFFTDLDDVDSEEFIKNRSDAKKRLAMLLTVEPKVEVNPDDIILYPGSAMVNLKLLPLTDYKISIKNTKIKELLLKTPENKYLGINAIDPVSLYQEGFYPKFELIDYDSSKTEVDVKICKIKREEYFKIEILSGRNTIEAKDFLINKIDKLNTIKCETKKIIIREKDNNDIFVRKPFDFNEYFKDKLDNGLYYVTFDNYIDRDFNGNIQKPLLFGIVNSHITMKISRNGEAFFFISDFKGNPLANQEISVELNDFQSKKMDWDNKLKDYKITYFSPIDTDVLRKKVVLGLTGADGILRTDIKDKVKDYFGKTFGDKWEYDWSGIDNSFFIFSHGDGYNSYNHSKWNAGIAPWNFGYKISGWYDENSNDISLSKWGRVGPDYYSYIYSDRVLYLPGEEVFFKSIIRKSNDLGIIKNKEFKIIIKDPKQKEIYNKTLKTNEFGSIFDSIKLSKTQSVGYYTIILKDINNKQLQTSTFSVEVFKNPKFKTDISLETVGLEAGNVNIKSKEVKYHKYWTEKKYIGKFDIKARLGSLYYNGSSVANAAFTYKVYKQPYYKNSWWDDCYYGCNWEPNKEFYTSGKGKLDENGIAIVNIPVDFESNYDDFKYILEVTVTDSVGDKISSSNSIIAKLPSEYKKWNNNFNLKLTTDKNFYKHGEKIKISGKLDGGAWTKYFDDKYFLIIKKKDFETTMVKDVRGFDRPITKQKEKLIEILPINSTNFNVNKTGELSLNYNLKETGEYIFEYGQIDNYIGLDDDEIKKLISDFNKTKLNKIKKEFLMNKYTGEVVIKDIKGNPIKEKVEKEIAIDELLNHNKKYFSILSYGDIDAKNPIVSDNKVKVYSEKISYNLGDKARVLVRLPFSKGKILWTIEKAGVVTDELIDINSNIFFKEIDIDDTFIPNAYIGVVAIEVDGSKIPEYKVGYTEVVVDKTDKKSFITVKTDKKTYKPREKVKLDLSVKNKAGKGLKTELSVMVIDDSLISLMGNIDLGILEKFYKKLPFQIQTSLTNLAMLKNYYFAKPGIVGGSGNGNFKGGDSVVSSRNIFKNTAYYNASIISDEDGKANVEFELPDNLTNFRIIVIGNSLKNYFGVSEEYIEVRKEVLVELKAPIIIRRDDKMNLSANIFNNSNNDLEFEAILEAEGLKISGNKKSITVGKGKSGVVSFDVQNKNDLDIINYKITIKSKTGNFIDILEGKIDNVESPAIVNYTVKNGVIESNGALEFDMKIGKNTDRERSNVSITFSNTLLSGIEKIVNSLATYPYGCIEQTTSSTMPNVILKKFKDIFKYIDYNKSIDDNIKNGLERIYGMQTSDGGFAYWPGGNESNLHITPYVLRSLMDMKGMGAEVSNESINKAVSYLRTNINLKTIEDTDRVEVFWALSKAGYGKEAIVDLDIYNWKKSKGDLSRHESIAYAYGFYYINPKMYTTLIDNEIKNIISKLEEKGSYRYWNKLSDKAIFASLLLDYNPAAIYTDSLIKELYDNDWNSYYYSTQTKNNAFIAFSKYIVINNDNYKSKYGFSLGTVKNITPYWLGKVTKNIKKFYYKLSDSILDNVDVLDFKGINIEGKKIYTNILIKQYPKKVEEIKAFSYGVKVKRDIYEVLDASKMDKCEKERNSYYNRGKDLSYLDACKGVYVKKTDNNFKRGVTYKTNIKIIFDTEKVRKNIVVEDYIASTFRVLNNKFQTNSITTNQNTTASWRWNHIEFLSDRVFANSSSFRGKQLDFDYFFIPEFVGDFTYPPVITYLMYNPEIRANSKFEIIHVR